MENITYEDDCDNLLISFKYLYEIFTTNIRKYFKMDPQDIRNKNIILEKENELDLIIENLQKKYNYLEKIKYCKLHNHENYIFQLDNLIINNKRMITSYLKQKSENFKIISNLPENIQLDFTEEENFLINNEESKSSIKEKNVNENNNKGEKIKSENNFDNKNNNKLIENNFPNFPVSEEKTLSEKINDTGEIDFFTLEEILEKNCKEYKGDIEFKNNIIKVKNQIQDLTMGLESEIYKSNEQIESIGKEIEKVELNVDETNESLRKGAIHSNETNKLKLPFIIGGIGTTIGFVVPGIGNLIGGSLGALVGVLIAKLERKQIQKIEPNKYE